MTDAERRERARLRSERWHRAHGIGPRRPAQRPWLAEASAEAHVVHSKGRTACSASRELRVQDFDAVRNAILEPWSSGQTEGQINRLKDSQTGYVGRAGRRTAFARG